jgi:hypothetical protein
MSIEPFAPVAAPLERPRVLEASRVEHRLSEGEEYVRSLLQEKQMTAVRTAARAWHAR